MKRRHWMWSLAALGGLCPLLWTGPAAAQMEIEVEREVDEPVERVERPPALREAVFVTERPDPNRPRTAFPAGMALQAGGGVAHFTAPGATDVANIGGAWNARLIVGTRSIIGGEIAYLGTSQGIDAPGLDPDAALMSHGVEGLARLNFLSGMWQPYIAAGVGWSHYRVINADFNVSAIQDVDNIITFPMGAGLAFRYRGLVIDARAMFRPVIEDQMFDDAGTSMHTWNAQLSGGWEF